MHGLVRHTPLGIAGHLVGLHESEPKHVGTIKMKKIKNPAKYHHSQAALSSSFLAISFEFFTLLSSSISRCLLPSAFLNASD